MSDYLKEGFIDEVKGALGDKNVIVQDALLHRNITMLSSDMSEVKSHIFAHCEQLVDVKLPNATRIGDYAFYNCNKLGDNTYPEVVSIGNHAFDGCSTMNVVTFQKVENIGDYAFYNCPGLLNLRIPNAKYIGNYAMNKAGRSCFGLDAYDPTGLISIGDYAFDGCYDLMGDLSLPMLTDIGIGAFRKNHMSSMDIPMVTDIPEECFKGCNFMTSFSATSAINVGKKAFEGCSQVATFNMPNVAYIGEYAFSNTSKSSTFYFPFAVTVETGAFYEAYRLSKIVLPEATYIGSLALATEYNRGNALKYVDLSKITKLPADVFGSVSVSRSYLNTVILRSNTMVDIITSDTAPNFTMKLSTKGYIYVPSALIPVYEADVHWSKFAGKFRALEDYTVDGTITGELDETKI